MTTTAAKASPKSTATKGTATAELESKNAALERRNETLCVQVEEHENTIAGLEAQNDRLVKKRGADVTDEVVMAFIKREAEKYDVSQPRGGPKRGPKAMRGIMHRFNQLKNTVAQYDEEEE